MTQLLKKDPKVDLRLKYRKVMEVSIIFALLIIIFTFYAFKKFEVGVKLPQSVDIKIEVVEIPPTEQITRPPPPSRPMIPIEAEDDELLDDVTIDETEVVFEARDDTPPPPPEDDEVFEFFAVSEKPVLIKKTVPRYPDLARKAQIEGKVVVTVTIDKKGNVESAKIFKSVPMLDEAAQTAALQCKFKPAKQRDKFVKVKMNIPFDFHLR
ncbi:MAG: energy transducer TonB [Calditrichia bacterium]